jgi:hypothetical protein
VVSLGQAGMARQSVSETAQGAADVDVPTRVKGVLAKTPDVDARRLVELEE